MKKRTILSVGAFAISFLAIVITIFTNRNNTPFQAVIPSPSPQQPAIIEVKSPGVFVMGSQDTDWKDAFDGESLHQGDSVKTNETGSAQVVFPDESTTALSQDSEITITAFESGTNKVKITLLAGKIWSRVTKVFGKETFETESENLVASVRGTSYGHAITKDGRDIVVVSESVVNCKCKVNKVWDRDINAEYQADYDCKTGRAPRISRLTRLQKLDKWYLENQDATASLTPTFKPIYTVKPTVKPTLSPTASSTPQPSPTSTPTPVPLTIGTVSVNCYPTNQIGIACGDRHTKFNVPGGGFDISPNANIAIFAIDDAGKQFTADAAYIGGQPTNQTTISSNLIVAHFSYSFSGNYSIRVVQNGQSVTSSNSVPVQ